MSISAISQAPRYPGPDYEARVQRASHGEDSSGLSNLPPNRRSAIRGRAGTVHADVRLEPRYNARYRVAPVRRELRSRRLSREAPRGHARIRLAGDRELPDHLSHVLPLLERMPPDESADVRAPGSYCRRSRNSRAVWRRSESAFLPVIRAIRERIAVMTARSRRSIPCLIPQPTSTRCCSSRSRTCRCSRSFW